MPVVTRRPTPPPAPFARGSVVQRIPEQVVQLYREEMAKKFAARARLPPVAPDYSLRRAIATLKAARKPR
jgi:hypothetical protein